MSSLVVLQDGKAVTHPLGDGETIVGRHPACTIQVQSNTVSRRHCHITKDGDGYFVEDLGSGNGTFLNGKQVESKTALKHEDRIEIGPILLRYEADAASRAAGSAAPPTKTGAGVLAETASEVDFEADTDEEAAATIMGTVNIDQGGFGVLDVQPEAKLKAILDISRSLAGMIDLESILPKVLDTLFEIFPHADRGCILLKDDKTGDMIPRAMRHRRSDEDATVKLSRTIVNKVLTEKTGILSADAASDTQFDASESISNLSIRSMMCVPILNLEGEPTGIINIDTQNPLNQFNNEDLDLLFAVAGQAGLSYESARLLVTFMEKQKQDGEMQIASNVQQALLPEKLPEVEGYEFFASYDAAQAVGGDYYDAFVFDDDKICLSFGDISGKGVPGAIIMSRMSSCVQSTLQFTHDPLEAVTAINHHMCDNAVEGRFVTYNFVLLDLKTHEISLVNAGHMPPMILKTDGSVEEFSEEAIGLPIGVMDDYPFEVEKRILEPGETVVLFTDGVDEAMDPDGNLYTLERMCEFITNNTRIPDELGKALLADVRKHANGRPQNDDITIMTFGRNPA